MKSTLRRALLTLSAFSMLGGATLASAPASSAATNHTWVHYSNTYMSLGDCNYYRSAVMKNIKNHGGTLNRVPACRTVDFGQGYTYRFAEYSSPVRLVSKTDITWQEARDKGVL